jgi:hypothetical protein
LNCTKTEGNANNYAYHWTSDTGDIGWANVGVETTYHGSSEDVEGMSPVPFSDRDFAGELVIVRSPVFYDPVSVSWLGQGGMGTADSPGVSERAIADGYLGWALRNEAGGVYLQSARMASNVHQWQAFDWDLWTVASASSGSYTFDIIDNFSGTGRGSTSRGVKGGF